MTVGPLSARVRARHARPRPQPTGSAPPGRPPRRMKKVAIGRRLAETLGRDREQATQAPEESRIPVEAAR